MRNFKMLLAYDGTRYRGWQRLGNSPDTIQGKLEQTLSRIMEQPIAIHGSGRTDAGAHAAGQVASFHADTTRSCRELTALLRQYLAEDLGVLEITEVPPRFHARLTATGKTYVYRVWNSRVPNVFERRYVYQLGETLDVAAMKQAAADFLGTHDFIAFCSNKQFKKSSVRTITALTIETLGPEVRFTVTGDGFLYNMVRIMVGTLLEIGLHRRPVDDIPAILASRSRERAGKTAPARGLCLKEVYYP